jgi:hypothetical protein
MLTWDHWEFQLWKATWHDSQELDFVQRVKEKRPSCRWTRSLFQTRVMVIQAYRVMVIQAYRVMVIQAYRVTTTIKPGGDNGSTCWKKGYFTWHKQISCTAYTHIFSVVSPLCIESGESPLDSRESILDYPVITSTSRLNHYARVEYIGVLYTSLDTPDWIRSRGNRSLSHNIPLTYTLNFRTTISRPRPPRCIVCT